MARHLKVLLPTKDILQALINGRVINYDVGYLNDQTFSTTGFGFDIFSKLLFHHTMQIYHIFAGIKAFELQTHRYTLKLQVE